MIPSRFIAMAARNTVAFGRIRNSAARL